ncbi:phage protease [Paenirhodobacter populi]
MVGRDGRRFDLAEPDAVIEDFRKRGVDLTIDYEHQNDVPDAKRNGPVPAAGWINMRNPTCLHPAHRTRLPIRPCWPGWHRSLPATRQRPGNHSRRDHENHRERPRRISHGGRAS